jgi:flagellar basal-body rod protein FlgF
MDRMLYVSMAGARQIMMAQTVNANNLANVNTTGFRADMANFSSMPVKGPSADSRVYTVAGQAGVDLAPGSVRTTGRDLDVAVNGEGYIAVQAPDGSEAYTRAGDLQVNVLGQLVTGKGAPVLGNGGPIVIPAYEKLEIGTDGTITVRPIGQDAATLAVVDRIKLVKPDPATLDKGEDGLLRTPVDAGPAVPDPAVKITSGALEGSNVSAVGAMVDMINLSRQFEMQVKIMKAAEDNDRSSSTLMRMTG